MQYSLHLSDGQSVLISSEDFSKVNEPGARLCPVLRQDARSSADATVWINPAHIVWVSRTSASK